MAAPDIVLQKPLVLIETGGVSILGGYASGSPINFGTIVKIYATSDSFEVGNTVLFNTAGQTLISYDDVEYSVIEENKIYYKEVSPP